MRLVCLITLLSLFHLTNAGVPLRKPSASAMMIPSRSNKKVVPVDVGLILDDEDWIGKMVYKYIQLALSDFYGSQGRHYKTRIVLRVRKYKHHDVVSAAAAALYLTEEVEVKAIIGPLTSAETEFIIDIGTKAQVPIISYSATSPLLSALDSPYFIRATGNDFSQIKAIVALIQAFGWTEVVPVYENDEYGQGMLPYLVDILQGTNIRITYRSVISPLATDNQILNELEKMKKMQTRVFIVHLSSDIGSRMFLKAKDAGMMIEGYVWILTTEISDLLGSLNHNVLESIEGVLGIRTYVPKTQDLENFTTRLSMKFRNDHLHVGSDKFNVYGLRAYDAILAMARVIEEVGPKTYSSLSFKTNRSFISSNLEDIGVSEVGPKLLQAISKTKFKGLAGEFSLVEGELAPSTFEIINVVGHGYRTIGFWTPEKGLLKDLNAIGSEGYSTSITNLKFVLWTGGAMSTPKGWDITAGAKKLKVAVPVKRGFPEFVKVTNNTNSNTTEFTGFCIQVFDTVMANLPYNVPYEYVDVAQINGTPVSFDALVDQVYQGIYDAVAGDVSIIANRSLYIDYTLPYTQSGVIMVVPVRESNKNKAWMFLRPLTWDLWVISVCFFVFIGFVIWVLEHRVNEDFRGPPLHQAGTTLYHSFSMMVFAQNGNLFNNLARFVMVVWIFVVFVLTQSYTASLTSMLTVQQLQPSIQNVNELIESREYVGYQEGTFVEGLLKQIGFHESRIKSYRNREELDEMLSKGSKNGGIAAVFDEIPYMTLFLAKYCNKYVMVQPTYKIGGFGFVFAKGSPLVYDVSRSILNVTQGNKMSMIENEWFQKQGDCGNSSNEISSDSLGLESFWGLFLIAGAVSCFALAGFLFEFLYKHRHIWMQSNTSTWNRIIAMAKTFDKVDSSSHKFRKSQQRLGNTGCRCDKDGLSTTEIMANMACPPTSWSFSSEQRSPSPSPKFLLEVEQRSPISPKFLRESLQRCPPSPKLCDF